MSAPITSQTTLRPVDVSLAELIEKIATRLQNGESVDLEKLIDEHREHSDSLRELLPAMKLLAQMSSVSCKDELDALGQLQKYRVLAKLGEGGMGKVFLAVHTDLEKLVAIKVLHSARANDSQATERFNREIKAIGRLHHPNVVLATDAGNISGTQFLVMEYVDGFDLLSISKCIGQLRIADACELIRQAAQGLDYAHQLGLIHRDVKPSNLMLTKQGQVKVLDLGLALLNDQTAQMRAGLTTSGQVVGTLEYMAPEQNDNCRNVDGRADIYGLGATLYHLLVGAAPFSRAATGTPEKNQQAAISLNLPSLRERRSDIPDELENILRRMLAQDPNMRYATPVKLIEDLHPFVAGSDLLKLHDSVPCKSKIDQILDRSFATEPVSGCSRGESVKSRWIPSLAGGRGRTNFRRLLIYGSILPILLAGIMVVVRDPAGKEKARFQLDAGDKLEFGPDKKESPETKRNVQPDAKGVQTKSQNHDHDSIVPTRNPSGQFTVFAPQYDKKSTDQLMEPLREINGLRFIESVKALTDLKPDDSGVLFVVMNGDAFLKIGNYNPDQLKRQRIIGIGYGAAKLFGELGLEINWGACAHGTVGAPRLTITKNGLIDVVKFPSPFFAFEPAILDTKDFHNSLFFGMYVGSDKPRRLDLVDIIALQTTDTKYAAVVRQGRHILICVDAPVDQWSPDLKRLIKELAISADSHSFEQSDTGTANENKTATQGSLVPQPNPKKHLGDVPESGLAVFLSSGTTGAPGSINQVTLEGEIKGKIPVFEAPSGLVRRSDSLIAAVASPYIGRGQILLVGSEGTVEQLPLNERFPAPIAITLDQKTQDLLVADNEQNTVTRVFSKQAGETELLFRAPLMAEQKHYPSMSLAVVSDGHVAFSASDPKGLYLLALAKKQTLPTPLLPVDATVAADPTSAQWVAMLDNELKVFGGMDELRTIQCPGGSAFWHYRVIAFAPDGTLYVVLETGRGIEVQSVDLKSEKFSPHFVWAGGKIKCMTLGPAMDWKQ